MPGDSVNSLDRLKSIFSRKKKTAIGTPTGTAGTKTSTPQSTETKPVMPAPSNPATAGAPSSSEPTAPPAGQAPVDTSAIDTPTSTPKPGSDPIMGSQIGSTATAA